MNLSAVTGMAIALVVLISACTDDVVQYAGQYTATKGDSCEPDKAISDPALTTVIEIVQQGQGDSATYIAKVPMAAVMNVPGISLPASVNDKGELHFMFHQPGKSGLFGGEPSIDVTMIVKPNSAKKNHLWITRWEAVMTMLGETQRISPLEALRQSAAAAGADAVSENGLCLAKLTNT